MRAIDDLEQSQRKFLSEISNIQSKFIEQRHDFIAFKKKTIIFHGFSLLKKLIELFEVQLLNTPMVGWNDFKIN